MKVLILGLVSIAMLVVLLVPMAFTQEPRPTMTPLMPSSDLYEYLPYVSKFIPTPTPDSPLPVPTLAPDSPIPVPTLTPTPSPKVYMPIVVDFKLSGPLTH